MKLNDKGVYVPEDIAFVNTRDFSRAGQHFLRHGCYTFAPEGSYEYVEFWNIEEERILNGMTLPGKLIVDKHGTRMQEVHITGEHYYYLNYAPIRKIDRYGDVSRGVVKMLEEAKRKKVGFPDFWDFDYHYFDSRRIAKKEGLHMAVGKSRRKGLTYKSASNSSRQIAFFERSNIVHAAYDFKYITSEDQLFPLAVNNIYHLELHTDFARHILNDTDKHLKLGYRIQGTTFDQGYLSNLFAVSFKDNPKAAIGKDAVELYIEEVGDCPNLPEVLLLTLPTLRDGDIITGLCTVFGAITEKGGNWQPFKDVFYNPRKWGFMCFENYTEPDDYARPVCGFFFPYRANLVSSADPPPIDEHGNSIYEVADKLIAEEDAQKKKDLTLNEYLVWKAQYCNKPSEAFYDVSSGYFKSPELIAHYNNVVSNKVYKDAKRCGFYLQGKDGQVVFSFTNPETGQIGEPIDKFPLDSTFNNFDGCIVEFFTPYRDKNGNIPDNLYIAVNDPFGSDKSKDLISYEDSLGVCYIYEKPNNITPTKGDCIVASWIARPEKLFDYDKMMFRMCERWNARLGFENDRGQVIPHARLLNKEHLLIEEIGLDFKKEISGTRGRDYGMHMNTVRKPIGTKLIKEWLYTVRGVDKDGNKIYNFHLITDIGLLEELLKFNPETNQDRISCMRILMFYMKEYEFLDGLQTSIKEEEEEFFDNYDLFS